MQMKKEIQWDALGFGYIRTDFRYISLYKQGEWDQGVLSVNAEICLEESSCVLHYAQTCFEGLKAYRTADDRIVVFRPHMNAHRMEATAQRLEIPPFPVERFVDAVIRTVRANAAWVPPYATGATLYVRPLLFGMDAVIGVKPANEYQFRIFTTPVGPYFKGGFKQLRLRISQFDRAAPRGTGHIKAGLNYAMSLHPLADARRKGYDENLYLDPLTRASVEETGGANILFVSRDHRVITPKSSSILPSITRASLLTVAQEMLHLEVEEREVLLTELKDFSECALCGTAAVLSPVGSIEDERGTLVFSSDKDEMGPVTRQLYDTLTAIQFGRISAPAGWVIPVEKRAE